MPSTVNQLFGAAGLKPTGVVRWNQPVPESQAGVYAICLTDRTNEVAGTLARCPIDRKALEKLILVRSEILVDGQTPTVAQLDRRISAFWLPDETVLYIGLSKRPLRTRVREYYKTPLGARKPHAGGWWLKTLQALPNLWVHYASTDTYKDAENEMLRAFANSVSKKGHAGLFDRERVMPFANLKDADDLIKDNRIKKATGEMAKASAK